MRTVRSGSTKTLLLPGLQQSPSQWESHAGNEHLNLLILEDLRSCLGSADYPCDSAFSLTKYPGREGTNHPHSSCEKPQSIQVVSE